jgi:hypothetical protein
MALSVHKNIEDITLLLREIAPTIMIRSTDTIVWVSAFLMVFRIEHRMRRGKLREEEILELI